MDQAISDLSMACSPADAGKAMFLLSAPANEMNMEITKELGEYLKELAPKAIIRNGDYPSNRDSLSVTVMMPELNNVDRVKEYYSRTLDLILNSSSGKWREKSSCIAWMRSDGIFPSLLR